MNFIRGLNLIKGLFFASASDSSGAGLNDSVEIRYVSGSCVAGTSASSPGVPRHIDLHIFFFIKMEYAP